MHSHLPRQASNADPKVAPCRTHGFTLIELMVVVVIAGVLAAVAYPAYTGQVRKSRRAEAINLLSAIVQAQERYRANGSTYASTLGQLGIYASKITPHYTVALSGVGATAATASVAYGYQVTASTVSTSPQASDTQCATLTVKMQTGSLEYTATDSSNNATDSKCWPR